MKIENIVQIDKNTYVIYGKKDLITLSKFAEIGTKVLCLEDKVVYVYMEPNKWSSVNASDDPDSMTNVAEVGM